MLIRKLWGLVFLALLFQDGYGMCRRRNTGRDTNPGETDDRNPIIVNVENLPRYRVRYANGTTVGKQDHFMEGFVAGMTVTTCVFILWYNFLNEPLD